MIASPLVLRLSKGERPRSWFDRFTTSGPFAVARPYNELDA
jgi:hypothetical protein